MERVGYTALLETLDLLVLKDQPEDKVLRVLRVILDQPDQKARLDSLEDVATVALLDHQEVPENKVLLAPLVLLETRVK